MGSMSIWHWVIVAGIVMMLFGRGKISGVMGEFASGIVDDVWFTDGMLSPTSSSRKEGRQAS